MTREEMKKFAKEELGIDLKEDENIDPYSLEELFPFKPLVPVEPDCSKCKHYRFGEDGRDITCHDCKWNYNDMYEERSFTDCDRCLVKHCSYEPHSEECQSARIFEEEVE